MLAIVFPIFFGFILGDVGYGHSAPCHVLCTSESVQGRRRPSSSLWFSETQACRASSLVSCSANSWDSNFPGQPIIFSRHLNIGGTEAAGHGPAIAELMVLAIWIGILHITLGRVLGMINHARQDHGNTGSRQCLANFGWITVMWGILIGIWSMFAMPLMPDLTGLPVVAAASSRSGCRRRPYRDGYPLHRHGTRSLRSSNSRPLFRTCCHMHVWWLSAFHPWPSRWSSTTCPSGCSSAPD